MSIGRPFKPNLPTTFGAMARGDGSYVRTGAGAAAVANTDRAISRASVQLSRRPTRRHQLGDLLLLFRDQVRVNPPRNPAQRHAWLR